MKFSFATLARAPPPLAAAARRGEKVGSRPWSGPSMMKTMKMKCAPARRTQQAAVVMTTMSNADEDTQGAAQHNTGQPRT